MSRERADMSWPGIEPVTMRWEASTLAKRATRTACSWLFGAYEPTTPLSFLFFYSNNNIRDTFDETSFFNVGHILYPF